MIDAKQEFAIKEFCLKILKGLSDEIGEYLTNTVQTQKMGSSQYLNEGLSFSPLPLCKIANG